MALPRLVGPKGNLCQVSPGLLDLGTVTDSQANTAILSQGYGGLPWCQHSVLPLSLLAYVSYNTPSSLTSSCFIFSSLKLDLGFYCPKRGTPPHPRKKGNKVGWGGELTWWVKVLAQGTELGSLEAIKDRHLGLGSVIPALCQNPAGRDRRISSNLIAMQKL